MEVRDRRGELLVGAWNYHGRVPEMTSDLTPEGTAFTADRGSNRERTLR